MKKLAVSFGLIGTVAFIYFATVSNGDERLMMVVIAALFVAMTMYAMTMKEI